MFLKDSQSWTAAEYAYWKAFCETCEYFAKKPGVATHLHYAHAKKAVERYEAFKERCRELFPRQSEFEPELPNIETGDVKPKTK